LLSVSGGINILYESWKNRYFVLRGEKLMYYVDKEKAAFGSPKGRYVDDC